MAMFKDSPVWMMSTESLKAHLNSLEAPDRIYWDARQLKKEGRKFQNLDWAYFPKPAKIDGIWQFAAEEPEPVAQVAPPVVAPVIAEPIAATVSVPAAKIDEALIVATLEAISGTEVSEWILADCPHPAPASILAAKQALGAGWKQVQTVARSLA